MADRRDQSSPPVSELPDLATLIAESASSDVVELYEVAAKYYSIATSQEPDQVIRVSAGNSA